MNVLRTLGRLVLGNRETADLLSIENGECRLSKAKGKQPLFLSAISLKRKDSGQYCLCFAELEFPLRADSSLVKRVDSSGHIAFLLKSNKQLEVEWTAPLDALPATIDMFQLTIAQCLYEVNSGKPASSASDADLKSFLISESEPVKATDLSRKVLMESKSADFFIFDAATNVFQLKAAGCVAEITKTLIDSKFHLLVVSMDDRSVVLHEQLIDPDGTVHTDRPSKSFIWCHFSPNGQVWTFSLRFAEASHLMALSNAYGQTIYELLNEEEMPERDNRYLLSPFGSTREVEMTEAPPLSISSSEDEDEASLSSIESDPDEHSAYAGHVRDKSERYTSLAVGYKHDRSFVAKGQSIGVFRHTSDDRLEHSTDLAIRASGKGKKFEAFSPSKMMLHRDDSSLLLLNPADPTKLFAMDLERGQVADVWTVDEHRPVTSIVPTSKYAQMTGEPTLIGLNDNSLFRIDPRLPGTKRVDAESKTYVVKNKFSCGATTGEGKLAVGSAKGEIRLFNALDKRAKSLLPGFGDAIIGIDVTENGRWIVATCKRYLLLIDTALEGTDKNGFQTSLAASGRPPLRLTLKPEHVAYIGAPLSFTPARFSTGAGEERSIIASSGPYVVTWSLRRIKQGHMHDYAIKRYEQPVVADSFRYGQERQIVVALPEYVTMVSKKSLASPSPRLFSSPSSTKNQ